MLLEGFLEEFDDYNENAELTSESYFNFTTECAFEVKNKADNILRLTSELDEKDRVIRMSKEEISKLKEKIALTQIEKQEIKKEIVQERRSMKVDLNFLNKLNRIMGKRRGGAHLVNYQKRKVR